MNFLGHSYFKGNSSLFLVGSVCGDFYKGLPDKLTIPSDMIEGVRFHKRLDSLTDSTKAVAVARKKLSSYGLFAGIIADMFYDYFLAVHWDKFSYIPLEEHSDKVYFYIKNNKDLIPVKSQRTVNFMVSEDWLSSYRDIDFFREKSQRNIKADI